MLSTYRVYRYDRMDAPVVTAGTGAVLIGAQNGLFPDLGFNVEGEMGGLWAGEKKVCDGFFFAIDDVPLTCADACEVNPAATAFHYRMQQQELHVVRRQFIPDGAGGCVIELTVENRRNAPRMVEVSFTVRTDILTVAAARGEDGMELGRDVAEYDEATQAFYARDSRNPWHAVWGADENCRVLQADLPQTVYGFGNTQGKGVNGRLFYRLRVNAGAQATMRLMVAGGFASRSKAEDALAALRAHAGEMIAAKEARLAERLGESRAALPEAALERSWNWTRVCGEWLTRELPGGGVGLCADLPEHPSLFGEGFAQAMGALLPLGGGARVQQMLRTLVRVSEEAQLAPGRLARRISRSGRIRQVGGVKESAQFVALVHRVLLWTGDVQFARDMLPTTGLCVNYLRRATRGFEDVREDVARETRLALAGQAYILRLLGEDDAACRQELGRLAPQTQQKPGENAPLDAWAAWHGRQGHVEQMIGCLCRMAEAGAPGMPGAMKPDEAGVLLSARSAAGFIGPMTESLFGFAPDAASRTIAFAPHTPIGWDGWRLENVKIGGARVTLSSERVSPSQAKYTVAVSEQGWTLVIRENGEEKRIAVDGAVSLVMDD
ncbi:MAG: glycogen debranching N-terminal domain-containing protein [Candidatus Ventricola sp.]